jgi:hypothetical protein
MTTQARNWQLLAGVMWIVGAFGGHWLITPANHPEATTINYVAAWVQLVGCAAVAIWAWRRSKTADTRPAA